MTKCPDLAKEWHPTKNGSLTPNDVTCNSHQNVWWLYLYDDPTTNRHFEFEWQTKVISRYKDGTGCPYLSGQAVWKGYNDLASKRPDLIKQLHPEKNKGLDPSQIYYGSTKKVWWYLPYNDPITQKQFILEWEASINSRAIRNNGCPYLSGHKVLEGFNDLSTRFPKLANEWHPTRNSFKPSEITAGSKKKVWWFLAYDDPDTHNHFDFEWEASITSRVNGRGCPYLTGNAVWRGFNDLATKRPDLADQWHPTKNESRHPWEYTCGSSEKVWWYLSYFDEETHHTFAFVWLASIAERVNGSGCPFLTGAAIWPGFNDLKTKRPDLAKQWHPTKNIKTPSEVGIGYDKNVWWIYPYDDPETGKHFEFEWEASVNDRYWGRGCPYISKAHQKVWQGFNDLSTKRQDIATQWHPTKNGDNLPTQYTIGSNKRVWWFYHYYDPNIGKYFDFEWEDTIKARVNGAKCPYLIDKAVMPGYNDLSTRRPDLADEWHPNKNGNLLPSMVLYKSREVVWWQDPFSGHEWQESVYDRYCDF